MSAELTIEEAIKECKEWQQNGAAVPPYEMITALLEGAERFQRVRFKGNTHVLAEVGVELDSARETHAPMNSHHEGYAVILEELDELWEVCKANTHSFEPKRPSFAVGDLDVSNKEELRAAKRAAMRKEALQVAAMAVRFIEDVCDKST